MPHRLYWLLRYFRQRVCRGTRPRIARLYSQAESRRKSPDRERERREPKWSAARRTAGRFFQDGGIARHVFNADAGERYAKFLFGTRHRRQHDFIEKLGTGVL